MDGFRRCVNLDLETSPRRTKRTLSAPPSLHPAGDHSSHCRSFAFAAAEFRWALLTSTDGLAMGTAYPSSGGHRYVAAVLHVSRSESQIYLSPHVSDGLLTQS